MNKQDLITVFGGTGLLGGAIAKRLQEQGYTNIETPSRRNGNFNLLNQNQVEEYFKEKKPKYVFMTAGLVGGIKANNERSADFLTQNMLMILYVLESIRKHSLETKLLFTGSTCIYPRENPQPINEERLLAGELEETNKGYAMAKISGIVACELYKKQYGINSICVMPTNLYGPDDNYDLESGHFLAAVTKKFVDAKKNGTQLTFWGTGKPRREALYSEDCADACIYLMKNYNDSQIINIGTGFDNSIKEYTQILSKLLEITDEINWDTTKPDGTFEKRTDITRLKQIMPHYNPRSFEEGVKEVLEKDFEIQTQEIRNIIKQ